MSEIVYKATIYIRKSYTDDKNVESESVANQRKLIERYAESQSNIEIVSEKVDDGVSGIIFDRPAFAQMMNDIKSGKINCVIVKDLSRLGREYIETGRYLRQIFPAYGVRFIAINATIPYGQKIESPQTPISRHLWAFLILLQTPHLGFCFSVKRRDSVIFCNALFLTRSGCSSTVFIFLFTL